MLVADRMTPAVASHGECPFWDAKTRRIFFADVLAGAFLSVSDSGNLNRHKIPGRVATVIRRNSSNGFVIASESTIYRADDDLSDFEVAATIPSSSDVRTNDGGCDPLGGFVIGTMAYDERPNAGAVYRVSSDREIVQLLDSVSISNGVQWSRNGSWVYYIDTPTKRVDRFRFDPDTGQWTDRHTHIDLSDTPGFPDGMAIDEEDGLWIALWGGGAVINYDSTGRLVERVHVPCVTQVTSCAFGGEERTTLYITTSRLGLTGNNEPSAGALFAVPTTVVGAAPLPCSI